MKAPLLGLALCLLAPQAHAFGRETTSTVRGEVGADHERVSADGVYGRFEGDLDVGLGAGARYDGASERFVFGSRLSAHYFSLAGAYLEYSDAFSDEAARARMLGLGVDVRPLFIPRWAMDLQQSGAFFDLWLDSTSLSVGAYYAQPNGRGLGDERGFSAALGFGLPLALNASGPWLEARGALDLPDGGETRAAVLLLLAWHELVITPLSPKSERAR